MNENVIKNGSKFVRWNVVPIVLTILTVILGFMWHEIRNTNAIDMKQTEEITETRKDVEWIKRMMENGEVTFQYNGK